MANMEKIAPKLELLPAKPGCYLMKDIHQNIIYVGKAIKLNNRVRSYFKGVHDLKTTQLVRNIDDFEYIVCGSEKEALLMEINLIKKHTPRFNIMFMDDKSYPYIRLTRTKAPTLSVIRNNKDKNAYLYGPFPDAGAAHKTRDLLVKLYPLRKCRTLPKRPCLYYHLGECLAPCINDIDPLIYEKMALDIRRFLGGDTKEIKQMLESEMYKASEALNYERAKELKDTIDAIDYVVSKQNVMFKDGKDRDVFNYYYDLGYISIQALLLRGGKIINRELSLSPLYEEESEAFVAFIMQYYQKNPLPQEILLPPLDIDLANYLNTKVLTPLRGEKAHLVAMVKDNAMQAHKNKFEAVKRREDSRGVAMAQLSRLLNHDISTVEIYDNSHISGAFNVSAMVVFKDGKPSKKDYRLYKLDTYVSDTDSMKEVIYRRYVRLLKEQAMPNDLLLVDGGIAQIHACKTILNELEIDILVAGLVKDERHRTNQLIDENGQPIAVAKDSALFFLLTQIQDEVHRVAITYHQKLRSKAQTRSILDEINGLGKVRKKALMKHFHTLSALKAASIEDISAIVPLKVAENVYRVIHD